MAVNRNLTRVTLFVLILLSIISIRASATSDIQFLKQKAIYLQDHSQYYLASNVWKQLLLVDPNNVDALTALATIAVGSGHKEKAIGYLDQIKAIAPNSPDISRITAAMNASPKQERLLREAASLQASKSYAAAVSAYDRALHGMPVPPNLAAGYFNALANIPGRRPQAIATLEDLVKAHPQDLQYALVLGQILTYSPDSRTKGIDILARLTEQRGAVNDQARQYWRQALIWEGTAPAAAPLLSAYLKRYPDATLATQLEKAEAAAAAVRRGSEQRAISAQERAGYAALHAGRLEVAEQIFKTLVKAYPQNWRYIEALADVHMAAHQFPLAVNAYQQAEILAPAAQRPPIEKSIKDAQAYARLQLASNATHSGEYDSAIRYYQAVLDEAPNNAAALSGLAGAYTAQKKYSHAIAIYRKAIASEPDHASFWIGLIGVLHSVGQDSVALEVAHSMPETVRNVAEKDAGYWATIGGVYAGAKQYAEARSAFQKAMHIGRSTSPALQLQLAWVLYDGGSYNELRRVLGQIADQTLTPDQRQQLIKLKIICSEQLANTAVRNKDYPRALAILKVLSSKYPMDPGIQNSIVNTRILEAWKLYRDRNDQELYNLLIRLHSESNLTASQQQQIQEIFRYAADREASVQVSEKHFLVAADIYHNMIQLFPHNHYYMRQLANIYSAAGQPADAYRIFLRVGLGDNAGNYAEAVSAAFAAHELDHAWQWTQMGLSRWPDNPALLKLAAKIADARGDPVSALAYYQKLLSFMPKSERRPIDIFPVAMVAEPLPPFSGE